MQSITLHTKVIALKHKISSSEQFHGRIDGADDRTVKTVFVGKPDGRRKAGRLKLRWLDCTENYLKTMGAKRRSVFI